MDSRELMSIGAFARASRLSAKALRLYDRQGLLAPVRTDPDTGYRWYGPEQVEQARTVVLLRRLDMPLARIAEVLALPAAKAAEAVAAYWADVEGRLAEQRFLASYLRGRLSGQETEMYEKYEVRVVETPASFVLAETRHTLADELPAWIGAALGRLEAGAAACGGPAGVPWIAYHAEVTQESDGPAEACVPVADRGAAVAWAAEHGLRGAVVAREEPARRLAYTRITKAQVAYPQIIEAFAAVEHWVEERGLSVVGPCRELYFAAWDGLAPEDPACDIAFPVG